MTRPNIGRTLVSARSFDEYVAMFALTERDLAGSVLDCPGGASSFTSHACSIGAHAVAMDPVYAQDPRWLARHAVDEALRGNRHTARTPGAYSWSFFTDIDDHRRQRQAAAEQFGADLLAHPERYVAAALPRLPLRDRSVDLVRVARREVRIFPLISDGGGSTAALLDAVTRTAAAMACSVEVAPSPYEFARGGNEMLVITRS